MMGEHMKDEAKTHLGRKAKVYVLSSDGHLQPPRSSSRPKDIWAKLAARHHCARLQKREKIVNIAAWAAE